MPATVSDGLFARQLRRAAARRGRLDPVYQRLSDHWTLILQRLYPVWALIGPGLANPAHIELHSRTICLDSDALLGTRAELLAGTLERGRVLACLGAALHEVMHAKHTKRWVADHDHSLAHSDDPAERQLAADRALLEEPRMEAHGCRDFPLDSARGDWSAPRSPRPSPTSSSPSSPPRSPTPRSPESRSRATCADAR